MWEKPKIKKLQIEENHTLFIRSFSWDHKKFTSNVGIP